LKRRAKRPGRRALAAATSSAVWVPLHHFPAGTVRRTAWTCWPHPAQVVFSQTRHVVGRHMVFSNSPSPSLIPSGVSGGTIPPGVQSVSTAQEAVGQKRRRDVGRTQRERRRDGGGRRRRDAGRGAEDPQPAPARPWA